MKLYPFLVVGLVGVGAWIGCGSSIESQASSGSGGGASNGGGPSASSATSSGSMGTGGTGGTSASGGGSTSTGGGGGSNDPCPNAYLTISTMGGDPPPVIALNRSCPNGWGSNETKYAVGYEGYTSGLPGAMHELFIEGCQGPQGPGHLALQVPLFDVGMSPTDSGLFQLSGTSWQTTNGITVTITSFGGMHQLIEGSYDGMMSDGGGQQHHVAGAFGVCHVADYLPP
jgi:hypothetical protein